MKRSLGLALCTALAVALNHWPLTLYFHSELLLGGSLGVLALLLWGWPGLVVGVAGLLGAQHHLGHGLALINGTAALLWLQLVLRRNQRRHRPRDNGRIVLAALAYWLTIGAALELIWYQRMLGLAHPLALAMAGREVLAGVLCAVIGNALYVGWLLLQARRHRSAVALRGVLFALLTALLSAPALLVIKLRAAEVHRQVLNLQEAQMLQQARLAVALGHSQGLQPPRPEAPLLLEHRQPDGRRWQSNPELLSRLDRTYAPSRLQGLPAPGPDHNLQLLVPRGTSQELLQLYDGYWQVLLHSADGSQVRLLQEARPLLLELDGRLQGATFGTLLLVVALGILLSDRLAAALTAQVDRLSRTGSGQALQPSGLRELDALVRHVSQRERQLTRVRRELISSRQAEAETALALTAAIPVGTFTLVPGHSDGRLVLRFASASLLQILGVEAVAPQRWLAAALGCLNRRERQLLLRRLRQPPPSAAPAAAAAPPVPLRRRLKLQGSDRWLRVEVSPRWLAELGTVWEGVVIDVTAETQRTKRLELARQQLLGVLENLPVPAVCLRLLPAGTSNLQGEVMLFNRQFLATFGYSAEELSSVGAWAERAYPDPRYRQEVFDRFDAALERSRHQTGLVESFDASITCRDQRVREVQIHAVVSSDLLIVTLLDQTERRLAERNLAATLQHQALEEQRQRQLLERKLRSSLSAAAVVHEIKQPLSTMLLQCRLGLELVQERGLEASYEVQRTLQTLNDQADRVVEIMERMRMLLRNVETEHKSLDLTLTLESALLVLRRELRGAAIDLQTVGLNQPCPVLGDAVQLQIAIANVIRNAIEAMVEDPGPRRLLVELSREATAVILRIEDSGPGLTDDTAALLLSSSKPQGSGIGLFVVQTTLEHHQGRLVIGRSEQLGGARVELHLPSLSRSNS